MKDIKWLKEEVEKDIHHVFAEGDIYYVSREHILGLINQLDKPEVLSEEWIDECSYNIEEYWQVADMMDGPQYAVSVENLQNLLVPKQEITEEQAKDALEEKGYTIARMYDSDNETVLPYDFYRQVLLAHGYLIIEKPVIPKFVADFIEVRKGTDAYSLKYILRVAVERCEQEEYAKAYDWISANDETFARAWLDGFTVEEEQKYEVRCKGELLLTYYTNIGEVVSMNRWDNHLSKKAGRDWKLRHELTEQEIKDYDERYWSFAKEVTE